MDYEDRIRLETPEGLAIELQLAGLGSRFSSAIVDHLIQLLAIIGIGLVASPAGVAGAAVYAVIAFAIVIAYDTAFETANGGQTPGKRMNGLRVVRATGEPVTFPIALVRNLLRLVDFLPTAYAIGLVSVLASARNQRLGDMAAGTIVVRERRPTAGDAGDGRAVARIPLASRAETARWDATGVSAEDIAVVRTFLTRRTAVPAATRDALASRLAARMRPQVRGVDPLIDDEVFLEWLVALKSDDGAQGEG